MFNNSAITLLLLTISVVIAAANLANAGEGASPKAAEIQPRLLWSKRGETKPQQPIIIWQPNKDSESERHHHHPYYPDYYPYPPPPPRPRPPFQIPGLNDYLSNGGPSIIIINPNNAQNLTFPAAAAASSDTTGGRSGANRRSSIMELLQGLNTQGNILEDDSEVITAADNSDGDVAAAAAPIPLYGGGGEERDDDVAEDELALLERQAARGLSPKHLLSFLLQDKRRRRIQEAVASIYLRNYNLNRK